MRYGAIPYELTHPGKHCELLTETALVGRAEAVVCQGRPGVTGAPGSQPALAGIAPGARNYLNDPSPHPK